MNAKPILSLIGILLSINLGFCQDQRVVDSLKILLQNKTGGERFEALFRLAFEYLDADNHKALNFIELARESALLSGDSVQIVRSIRVKGQILYKLEMFSESIVALEHALTLSRRSKLRKEELHIRAAISSCYLFIGQYDKGLRMLFGVYDLATQLQDSIMIGQTLHNLGVHYYKIKNYKKALIFLTQSLAIYQSQNMARHYVLMNIALAHAWLTNYDEAKNFVNESLRHCSPKCDKSALVHIYYTYGSIALGEKRLDEALEYFLKSYRLAKETGNLRMQLDNINLIANIYLKQDRLNKAHQYLSEGEELIDDKMVLNLEKLSIYNTLHKLYLQKKDYENVALYLTKYVNVRDSIYSLSVTNNLVDIEAEFQQKENRETIASQAEVIVLNRKVIESQQRLNVATAVIAIISFAFLVVLFRGYRQKRSQAELLERKVAERTREIEKSREELIKGLQARDIIISRAREGLAENLSSLKGLYLNGLREVSDPLAKTYLARIEKISRQLSRFTLLLVDSRDRQVFAAD